MGHSILFCATVDYHFSSFHIPYLKWFKEQGWEVHVAAAGIMELPYVDKKHTINIQRSPYHHKNIQAYRELKKLMNQHHYQIIHCHTPMGGVIGRLAAKNARKSGTKVLYTAHGFHFCKGSPIINWLVYYPIEKSLTRYTDTLITINDEDHQLAAKKFRIATVEHVNGVGVDTEIFKPLSANQKAILKKSFGYKPNDFLLFYAAEFNKNKNQQLLIQAVTKIAKEIPNVKLLLAGSGALQDDCRKMAKEYRVEDKVDFLGYRHDIADFLPMCDVAVASSQREGLPVNIMEAMACGLPVIATDNRGHRELVIDYYNGWITHYPHVEEFSDKLRLLAENENLRHQYGLNGRKRVIEKYSIEKVLTQQQKIYLTNMGEAVVEKWAVH